MTVTGQMSLAELHRAQRRLTVACQDSELAMRMPLHSMGDSAWEPLLHSSPAGSRWRDETKLGLLVV
jgi:hypothetical protein